MSEKPGVPVPMPAEGTLEYGLLPGEVRRRHERIEARSQWMTRMAAGFSGLLLAMLLLGVTAWAIAGAAAGWTAAAVILALGLIAGGVATVRAPLSGPSTAEDRRFVFDALREPADPEWHATKRLFVELAEADVLPMSELAEAREALRRAMLSRQGAEPAEAEHLTAEIAAIRRELERQRPDPASNQLLEEARLRLEAADEVAGLEPDERLRRARAQQAAKVTGGQ